MDDTHDPTTGIWYNVTVEMRREEYLWQSLLVEESFFTGVEVEPRALCMLEKCSTIKSHLQRKRWLTKADFFLKMLLLIFILIP